MSGDAGEKTFEAPPSRIAKARREGNVARAAEFAANLAFVAAALAVLVLAAPIGALAREAMARAAGGSVPALPCTALVVLALLPMGLAALSGALGGAMQNGGVVFAPVAVKLERLQPLEGLRRMFSREAATHGVRALAAFTFAVAAMVPTLHDLVNAAAVAPAPRSVASIAWSGAQHVVFAAAAVGLLFAVAEYAVARRAWLRKLRMSLAELKRELKESDGDPLARGRRKSLHRNLVRGALARVKDASFVVVNPTHVAVALEYRPPAVPVPRVLVRAADEAALRVRALAAEHRVPLIENVALARGLYRDCAVGEPIVYDHYVAVAEVVAALLRSGALERRA
ncbi:MAG TPA: EscU/YscU/HrcU family type III secretion system export apparatus switch protein [Candidatus Baltobacteraceae bacterium]|nr:EscU/YscU/HrcU family type III secretion system export apparatus switch protein [Candidatus Baltobacteraceae bacterium]